MGKRGPRAKPTKLKLLAGNPGKRKLNDLEPEPPRANLVAPDDLKETGLEIWNRTALMLDTLGVVSELDLLAFHTYCRAHDEIAECDDVIANEGTYYTTDKGTKCQHPAVNQRFKWLDLKRRYEAEFGMTPSSRSGVQSTKPPANAIPKRKRSA
jgi:P27 family predicted phage terminase small subunit